MLQDYGIFPDVTIILNTILLGGCSESRSKGPISFKDVVKGKVEPQSNPEQIPNLHGSYIMEQKSRVPALTVTLTDVNNTYSYFHTRVVICRFNGFCPKS